MTRGPTARPGAGGFYAASAAELGVGRMMESERFVAWGTPGGAPMVGLAKPFDGQPATVGNGTMVALAARDRDHVARIHALALRMGAADEGAPGPRGDAGFFAGYFRDPDGNKLSAFTMEG